MNFPVTRSGAAPLSFLTNSVDLAQSDMQKKVGLIALIIFCCGLAATACYVVYRRLTAKKIETKKSASHLETPSPHAQKKSETHDKKIIEVKQIEQERASKIAQVEQKKNQVESAAKIELLKGFEVIKVQDLKAITDNLSNQTCLTEVHDKESLLPKPSIEVEVQHPEIIAEENLSEPSVLGETPDHASLLPIPPIKPIQELQLIASHKAFMTILTRSGGLAGAYLDDLPAYLYDWECEEKPHFMIEPDTLFLRFVLFDSVPELKEIVDLQPYLPAVWFEGKKENDVIRLTYKGHLIELTLNHVKYQEKGGIQKRKHWKFEDIFKSIKSCCLNRIKEGKLGLSGSLFENHKPLEGYSLKSGGALYQVSGLPFNPEDYQKRQLKEADAAQFRKAKNIGPFSQFRINVYNCYKKNDDYMFQFKMPGIGKDQQIDIVVNDKFLCVYAEEDQNVVDKSNLSSSYLCMIPWKKFYENTSLEEMKKKIMNSTMTLSSGVFIVSFISKSESALLNSRA